MGNIQSSAMVSTGLTTPMLLALPVTMCWHGTADKITGILTLGQQTALSSKYHNTSNSEMLLLGWGWN